MSEKISRVVEPNLPDDLAQFEKLDQMTYKNGADHVYGVDKEGKKTHISNDDVLEAYGYDPNQTQDSNDPFTPDPSATSLDTTPERPDQDLYDEYAKAVKDESATVRVRNPETGKMEVTKVKDLNFREWIKQSEMRKAAKWYTATRAHGEGLVEGIDYATEAPLPLDLTNEELDKLDNTEHAEQLNAREGKPNPSNDDVEYYRWLKASASKKNYKTPEAAKSPGIPKGPGGGDKDPEVPVVTPQTPEEDGPELPTQPVPVLTVPEGPRVPEREPVRPGRVRKFGRACLAALAIIAPTSYLVGRAHENYIVKSHDTPSVDEINKFEDHTRDVPEVIQENMVRNFDTATEFLAPGEGVTTEEITKNLEERKSNFNKMEEAIDTEVAKITQQYGDALTDERIEELAKIRVAARLHAIALQEEEASTADYAKNPKIPLNP